MQPQKAQKIDLTTDYPCPCPRRGRIIPIALTEAFGCNRCQQIYVVEENGYVIEQLSTTYPYKRSWRWTGHKWIFAHSGFRENYLSVSLAAIIILLVICLPLALRSSNNSGNTIAWVTVIILLAMLPALMLWLASRR